MIYAVAVHRESGSDKLHNYVDSLWIAAKSVEEATARARLFYEDVEVIGVTTKTLGESYVWTLKNGKGPKELMLFREHNKVDGIFSFYEVVFDIALPTRDNPLRAVYVVTANNEQEAAEKAKEAGLALVGHTGRISDMLVNEIGAKITVERAQKTEKKEMVKDKKPPSAKDAIRIIFNEEGEPVVA